MRRNRVKEQGVEERTKKQRKNTEQRKGISNRGKQWRIEGE